MSTGAIIAIVVIALIIIGVVAFLLPQMRERSRLRARESELEQRRHDVASEHREEAQTREQRAAQAEQRARIAEQEAQRERAEAQLHEERASLHEQGLADDELVEDHEREHFAGTSAVPDTDRDSDDPRYDGVDDRDGLGRDERVERDDLGDRPPGRDEATASRSRRI